MQYSMGRFYRKSVKAMPDYSIEEKLLRDGHSNVAGVDEAGRGPLAGPVVAATVILPSGFTAKGLNDSKKLSAKSRLKLYFKITATESGVIWAAAEIGSELIDEINILNATYKAMAESANRLKVKPSIAIIDGNPVKGFPFPHQAIIKGDTKSLSIAAASVIAKVRRDQIMVKCAKQYPQYGFERHKGYGTKVHMEALVKFGPCPIHRRSFAPVSENIR